VHAESPSVVALILARAGSKRVIDKSIRPLGGHPVLAYTIAAVLHGLGRSREEGGEELGRG
jgi:spore coat polysaccharide biosynthesis protein SpsF (cytidylyltransferase family)